MKKMILITLILSSFQVYALSGREAWTYSNMQGKQLLMKEYKNFFEELQKTETFSELEVVNTSLFNLFISEAFAAPEMDCIYAGWPSKRVNNLCSSPAKHNPDYSKSSCGQNQLQCQPLLFGKGICVPVSTSQQRNLAFSNCDQKYKQKKSSPETLIKEIRADGNEKALFELLDFADKICSEGKQKGTGMCTRLMAAVDSMRHFKTATVAVTQETAQTRGPAITSPTQIRATTEKSSEAELVQTVATATRVMEAIYDKDCEPEMNGEPFEREEPRFKTSGSGSRTSPDGSFDYHIGIEGSEIVNDGFTLRNVGPNTVVGEAIDPREKADRMWTFHSEDDSRRETYLWITDNPGSGRNSDLMETIMVFLPRKMKQKIEVKGDDLHVTLTTGEKVILDKKTKAVKAGAFTEGKLDTNPNKNQRKNASVQYKGTGISIRVDSRGNDPRIGKQATISQNGKSCKVPSSALWSQAEDNQDFKFSDDKKLVQFLNGQCKNIFSI